MNPTELVELVIELGHERLADALELLHPDAEWVVDTNRPPLRGHDEITRFVAEELERLGADVPERITNTLTQRGNVVLVYGQLRIPHTHGRPFVEMRQIAWVYEVEGDRIARVTVYRTWAEAGRAAGIEPGTPPTRRFQHWRLAVARLRPLLQLVPA
jgi:ketosteroid isomerase-like protein